MSQRQKSITWQDGKAVLKGCTDRAKNRGFRMDICFLGRAIEIFYSVLVWIISFVIIQHFKI